MPPKKTTKPAAKGEAVTRSKPAEEVAPVAAPVVERTKAAVAPTAKPAVADVATEAAGEAEVHPYAGKTVKATLMVGATLTAYGTTWTRLVPQTVNDPDVIKELVVDGCFSVEFLS